MQQESLEELLSRTIHDKSHDAFNKLAQRTSKTLFRFALSLTKDYQQAEDLVQESFFKIFRSNSNYDKYQSALTYMRGCIRNLYIDGVRRDKSELTETDLFSSSKEESEETLSLDEISLSRELSALKQLNRDELKKEFISLAKPDTAERFWR